jgi:hypothetical protein
VAAGIARVGAYRTGFGSSAATTELQLGPNRPNRLLLPLAFAYVHVTFSP